MRSSWIVETQGQPAPEGLDTAETQVTGAAADPFADGYAALLRGVLDQLEGGAW